MAERFHKLTAIETGRIYHPRGLKLMYSAREQKSPLPPHPFNKNKWLCIGRSQLSFGRADE